ncbi:MAG: hypothetical protein M3Z37_08935, partial [Candidatus Eremiobacteraeota bacterium]|nr:hypothetical protein [Candidatus Eremiobacteraeota bacterium]
MQNLRLPGAARIVRWGLLGGVLALVALTTQQRPTAAQASVPSALEIADHQLAAPAAVEDEGVYRLIDPVGPGGLTRQAAIGEVVASTMQGGAYGDQRYFGQYGNQIYIPPAPAPAGYPHPRPWEGQR